MNKRSKRYTDEFKMLILELLEEGRTKKIIRKWIWYNNSRIHSKIGFTSPNKYEKSIKKGNKEIA